MKLRQSCVLLAWAFLGIFSSCETEGTYEIYDTIVTVDYQLDLVNNKTFYRIDFGDNTLSKPVELDSLGILREKIGATRGAFIKEKDLTQDLKIWKYDEKGNQIFESTTRITAPANGTILLLQLLENAPLTVFDPKFPAADQPTETNVQFFYGDIAQPAEVNVSILAVDYYYFLTDVDVNFDFNKLPANRKKEIANFKLMKAKLSENISLDLDLFNDENDIGTAFFYKITDASTGKVLQEYEDSTKSQITVDLKNGEGVLAKYKHSLIQWNYLSTTTPFKSAIIKKSELW